MIFSREQLFSYGQVVSGSAVSTNVIDLGTPGTVLGAPAALVRDIGKGNPIPVSAKLAADAGGTSPTIQVQVQGSTDEAFTSPVVLGESPVLANGQVGDELYTPVQIPEGSNLRYLRLNYVGGGTSPVHNITAGVVAGRQAGRLPGV